MNKYRVVAYTPNGREIRENLETGKIEVQPRNDNYWIECNTIEEAWAAFDPDASVPGADPLKVSEGL